MKYLLLLLLAAIVWRAWQKRPAAGAKASRPERAPERMVACITCGVLMPESDALVVDGRHYCCEAHREAVGRGRQ